MQEEHLLEELRFRAESGDPSSQYKLALHCFARGDDSEGCRWLTEAARHVKYMAELGDDEARFYLAQIYAYGLGLPLDHVKAVDILVTLADQGYADAGSYLLHRYRHNSAGSEGDAKLAQFFQRQTESENPDGMLGLAQMYLSGRGVRQDIKQGIELLRKAARLSSIEAEYYLGTLFLHGIVVPKNYQEAALSMIKASDKGHVEACFELGCMYESGTGLQMNPVKALDWYQRAASRGHCRAQLNLSIMYQDGIGTEADAEAAARWLSMAVEGGDARAIALAESQFEEHASLLTQQKLITQANAGNSHAQFELALRYQRGTGVAADAAKSLQWLEEAANGTSLGAKMMLALNYKQGGMVDADSQKALQWFTAAAECRVARAEYELAKMLAAGDGVSAEPDRARYLLERAAQDGDPDAQFILACLNIVENNINAAQMWLLALPNHANAVQLLGALRRGELMMAKMSAWGLVEKAGFASLNRRD